jgi:hypothetical protein
MKTKIIQSFLISLTLLWISAIGSPLLAGPKGNTASDLNGEYTFVEDIMDCLDIPLFTDQVRIYDQHEKLVISGSSDDRMIKKYISRADLLTEVDHVQYYRMSYEEGNTNDYQFAGR